MARRAGKSPFWWVLKHKDGYWDADLKEWYLRQCNATTFTDRKLARAERRMVAHVHGLSGARVVRVKARGLPADWAAKFVAHAHNMSTSALLREHAALTLDIFNAATQADTKHAHERLDIVCVALGGRIDAFANWNPSKAPV